MKSKILIGLGLVALTLICCGCVEEEASYVLDDYNKYVDTMDEDLTKIDTIIANWNTAYEMAVADEDLTVEEVNQLIGIATDYSNEYKFVEPHLTSFKEFVTYNEQELKDEGVDTYQVKKVIDDADSTMRYNLEGVMIPNIEDAIAYVETAEQEEDIGEILELLLLLI